MRKLGILLICVVACVAATLIAQSETGVLRDGRSICFRYDPATLAVRPLGNGDYNLVASGAIWFVFANEEDAKAAVDVAKKYRELCYIGKDNTRPNRTQYIMSYFR